MTNFVPAYNPLAKQATDRPTTPGANGKSPYERALELVRNEALGHFNPAEIQQASAGSQVWNWVQDRAREMVGRLNDESVSLNAGRKAFEQPEDEIVQALLRDIFGLGELEKLMELPDVEDITINGPNDVCFKRYGRWEKSNITYPSSQVLQNMLNAAIVHCNRQVGQVKPIVDATLSKGHRINIVTAPVADPWPVASIRIRRSKRLTMHDLVARGGEDLFKPEPIPLPDYFKDDQGKGVFPALAATFLHMSVIAGFNILGVGATGVGKTVFLNALGDMLPSDRRVLVIEDTRELDIRPDGSNCVYFTTRDESVEGLPPITPKDLVRAALRQRPDALTLGEARGAEIVDLLKALWTGHKNGLTSIHADSIEDVPNRIRMMLQEASFQTEVSEVTIALTIAKAFHLAIMLHATGTGKRFVQEIAEFTGGVEGTIPVRTPLFVYDEEKHRLCCTGNRLHESHERMLRQVGYSYDNIVKAAKERRELW
jgi:pilus assembly protein CpaF